MLPETNSQTLFYLKSIATKCKESSHNIQKAIKNTPFPQEDLLVPESSFGGETIDLRSLQLAELLKKIAKHINEGPKASQ